MLAKLGRLKPALSVLHAGLVPAAAEIRNPSTVIDSKSASVHKRLL